MIEMCKQQERLKEQEKTVVSLTDEIGVLQNEVTRKQEQIDELLKLPGQLKESEKKVTELSDENENLQTEIKRRKQTELSKLSGQIKEKERKVTELSDENKTLKMDIKQRNQNELSKLNEQKQTVNSLTYEIGVLQNKLTKKQEEIDDLLKLPGQLKESEKKITELSDENENLRTEIKRRKPTELSNIGIVLVGKSGVGKSALGNTLLGRNAFESTFRFGTIAQKCKIEEGVLPSGKILQVVDTPGITSPKNQVVMNELMKSIEYFNPGPHAFLLVMQPSRSTKEDLKILKELKNVFGDASYLQNTIIIMVNRNIIRNQDYSLIDIHEYISTHAGKEVKEVYNLCGKRIIAVENSDSDQLTNERYRDQILDMVKNFKGCYSHSN